MQTTAKYCRIQSHNHPAKELQVLLIAPACVHWIWMDLILNEMIPLVINPIHIWMKKSHSGEHTSKAVMVNFSAPVTGCVLLHSLPKYMNSGKLWGGLVVNIVCKSILSSYMQGVVYVVCVSIGERPQRSGMKYSSYYQWPWLLQPEQNHSLSYSHPRPWGCSHNSQIFTSKHILRNNGTLWRLRIELCLLAYLA